MLYVSLSTNTLLLLVATNALAAVNYPGIPKILNTPVQQRLAINGPNSMSVGWNTYEQLDEACVHYGTSSTRLDSKACTTVSLTYNTSRTYSQAVTLTGLKSATKYFYKIESRNSSVEHFLSPRLAGDKTPFNMDVVIDLGVYGENGFTTSNKRDIPAIQPELKHSTIGALAKTVDDYEFVIHPGDFAYADDWTDTLSNLGNGSNAYQAILENFYDQLAPVAGRKAYMASPGNHEADCTEINYTTGLCPEGQQNFTDYMNRFGRTVPRALPSLSKSAEARLNARRAKELAEPPFWYSFEYGMAHIVMFDTETDFTDAPDGPDGSAGLDGGPFGAPNQQIRFLHADLASVDRRVTPWVIVAGHRPWYSTDALLSTCGPCQTAFESIFYEYGVDLVVTGHVHNSQRFNPIYDNTVDPAGMHNPKAPMYIIVGGTGNVEGLVPVGINATGNAFAYDDDFAYATVKFLDKEHLGVDFIRSSTLEVLDSSVLYKAHEKPFVGHS